MQPLTQTEELDEIEKIIYRIQNGTTLTHHKTEIGPNGEKVISLMRTPRQRKSTYVKKDPSEYKKNGRPPGKKDSVQRVRPPKNTPKKVKPLKGIAKDFNDLPEEYQKQITDKVGGTISLEGGCIIVEPIPLSEFLVESSDTEVFDPVQDTSQDNIAQEDTAYIELKECLDKLNTELDEILLKERVDPPPEPEPWMAQAYPPKPTPSRRVYQAEPSNRGRPKNPNKPARTIRCKELHKLRDDPIYRAGGRL
jgi:hypothetical protein